MICGVVVSIVDLHLEGCGDGSRHEGCGGFCCRGRERHSPVRSPLGSSFVHEAAIVLFYLEPKTLEGQGNGCGCASSYRAPLKVGSSLWPPGGHHSESTDAIAESACMHWRTMVTLASYIALNFHLSLSRVIASLGNAHDVFSFEAS